VCADIKLDDHVKFFKLTHQTGLKTILYQSQVHYFNEML